VIRAQLPITIAGTTVNRFCASGYMAMIDTADVVAHRYGMS